MITVQKDTSPFTPGSPVGIDLFAGRVQQIEEVSRYLGQASAGAHQSVFLIGDRGIGKSSFASVMRELAAKRYGMIGVHIHLGGVITVEELTRRVLQELMSEIQDRPWYSQIIERYGPYIQQVGLLGVKIAFHPPPQHMSQITQRFPQVLGELLARISDDRSGVAIVLDDINGLAETDIFARWYKSVVDEIATHFPSYPALMAVSGIPERRDQLAQHEPSLLRVFRIVELDRLMDDEVIDFYQRAFEQADMSVSDDAMNIVVRYSSGLPVMMQEIGDATFWADSDGNVSVADARNGVIDAAFSVGRKYLDPTVYRALRSDRYQTIVRKIADSMSSTFTRREVASRLTGDEMKVFDNLLKRLREVGVVELDPERGRGAYRYTNQIFPVYMYIESQIRGIAGDVTTD